MYLDVLNTFNFGKKSKKVSMKPLEFSTILKASKSQQTESGFKVNLGGFFSSSRINSAKKGCKVL